MPTVCHITFSPLLNDSRIMREAQAAIEDGPTTRVICIGYREDGSAALEIPFPGCEIWRISTVDIPFLPRVPRRILQWLLWNMALMRCLRNVAIDILQPHNLATMLAGVLFKRFAQHKPRLIYDAHELETERQGWGKLQRNGARILERAVISSADHVLVVGDLIHEWYRETYGLTNISVLRNVPLRSTRPIEKNRLLRDEFGIPDESLVFIYLGVIDEGRGYREIIEAFRSQPDKHIIFMGRGRAAAQVAQDSAAMPNLHWREPVPSRDVVHFTAGCDIGIALIEDTCLSYRYCLPNKLHEYRLAGLPVIVSDLPEMARYIDETRAGWKVAPNAASLRQLILALDRDTTTAKMAGIVGAPASWDDEKGKYLAIVRRLLT
jgi:glycosyltransferase involved in cell wall biosynthesis